MAEGRKSVHYPAMLGYMTGILKLKKVVVPHNICCIATGAGTVKGMAIISAKFSTLMLVPNFQTIKMKIVADLTILTTI